MDLERWIDVNMCAECRQNPCHPSCPEDEYNVWIGRAVALCKAVGRELPDWLIGKDD